MRHLGLRLPLGCDETCLAVRNGTEGLHWCVQGEGLIGLAESSNEEEFISREEADGIQSMQSDNNSEVSTSYEDEIDISGALGPRRGKRSRDIKLICIDMDGRCSSMLLLAILCREVLPPCFC